MLWKVLMNVTWTWIYGEKAKGLLLKLQFKTPQLGASNRQVPWETTSLAHIQVPVLREGSLVGGMEFSTGSYSYNSNKS